MLPTIYVTGLHFDIQHVAAAFLFDKVNSAFCDAVFPPGHDRISGVEGSRRADSVARCAGLFGAKLIASGEVIGDKLKDRLIR